MQPRKSYTSADELAGPADHGSLAAHPLGGPLWLAAGMLIAGAVMSVPGCMATGGPAVSAKGEVSVKEVSHMVTSNAGKSGGPTGEVTANVSFSLVWPGK